MNCKICDSPFLNISEDVCVLSCGHMFHSVCLEKWHVLSDVCPMCNEKSVCTRHNIHSKSTLIKLNNIQKQNINSLRNDIVQLSKEYNLIKNVNGELEIKLSLVRSLIKEVAYHDTGSS